MKLKNNKIGILGSGSWGTVLADIAANNGYEVSIGHVTQAPLMK